MAREIERIQDAVRTFNDDAADRRAFAAAIANAITNGHPMGENTVAHVEAVMARTTTVAAAVAAVEAESGPVFGPDVGGGRPGRPDGAGPPG